MSFVHLHCHTDASLKDGLGTIERLVSGAKSLGFEALAATDHGTLANVIVFILECQLQNVKPIIGLEAYVTYNSKRGHITLLADGDTGLKTLIYLNNASHRNAANAFPVELLTSHHEGLICLTGCQASHVQNLPLKEAVKLTTWLKAIFGDLLFIEAMNVNDFPHAKRAVELAKATGCKLVITNDAHFPYKDDADVHKILTKMKANFTYEDSELYLKSYGEMYASFLTLGWPGKLIASALDRTGIIASLISEYHVARAPSLPIIENANKILQSKVRTALSEISEPKMIARAKEELRVIKKMNYSTYFLILDDIISYAKINNIRIGPGRGSGAGSLVLYLLGITQINPLLYDLPFERFLNEGRIGMPDVDIDIDNERRQEVIDYAQHKWHAVPIATYSRYSHKSLVHDLSKQLEIPHEVEHDVAEFGEESSQFKELCEKIPFFGKCYHAILGQVRHKSKHAGGVIITDVDMPIEKAGNQLVAAWTEGRLNELSLAGIVKYDLLGLSALAVLSHLEATTGIKTPCYEEVGSGKEFEIFETKDVSGIFQFSGSSGMIDYTSKYKPKNLDDLIVINALYRPGALDVGATEMFLTWKDEPREVPDIIKDILAPTYGAVVYQEQVMQIFARITGGSLAEADEARRIIVKAKGKDEKKQTEFKAKFLAGAKKFMNVDEAEKLFDEIAAHSRYSFNKAHATAYAYIAWQLAWWKHNHPLDFYAQVINVDPSEIQSYIIAARQHKIKVLSPELNHSETECVAFHKAGAIGLPLTAVKFISKSTADMIVKERNTNGKFTTLKSVVTRIPKSVFRANARLGLAALGGMRNLEVEKSVEKDLQIHEIPELSRTKLQMNYMGVVIPSDKILALLAKINAKPGHIAGVIKDVSHRKSKWGEYIVYHLMPGGTMWARDLKEYEPGEIVAAKCSNGKASYIEVILESDS